MGAGAGPDVGAEGPVRDAALVGAGPKGEVGCDGPANGVGWTAVKGRRDWGALREGGERGASVYKCTPQARTGKRRKAQ